MSVTPLADAFDLLRRRLYEVNALYAAGAVMDWDHQCYMPRGSAAPRGEQLALLTGLAHKLYTSQETQQLLVDCENQGPSNPDEAALLRVVRRGLDQSTKLPQDLVEREALATSRGHESWVKARSTNSFSIFAPDLTEIISIKQEVANLLNPAVHPFEALIDQFEEGATKASCDALFNTIRQPLKDLVARIATKPKPDDSFLKGNWSHEAQMGFGKYLLSRLGFDLSRGRLDLAAHPFCTNFSVDDVRLTTRFNDELQSSMYSTLHEMGHGMYEQNSPQAWDRLPLAGGVSLGIHESQSRTWENIVGRSSHFAKWVLPEVNARFGIGIKDPVEFYKAINVVTPSLIRVEADEVTYNLHIMVRYELECDLLDGRLDVTDLPSAWNAKYQQYLGITPPTDSDGCLQDVHWSAGLFGYFPTYSIGNILSAQFWAKMEVDFANTGIGNSGTLIEQGDFGPILKWLTANIYSKGSSIQPQVLVQNVTGKAMDATDYMTYITNKYTALYP